MKNSLFCLLCSFCAVQLLAQVPTPSAGKIQYFANFKSKYIAARNVAVWLPTTYDAHKKYAVLYMHDGQMLFDSTQTWNKQEWGVDETMTRLLVQKAIKNCIVVGVWNGGALRHSEYFPQKPFEALAQAERDTLMAAKRGTNPLFAAPVQSDKYLQFLVTELKPFIDSAFATRRDRKHTFVAGSSMGGLISMYAMCEYPAVFGGAACLSTHWVGTCSTKNNPIPAAFMAYLNAHLPSPKTHKFYFDYGSETLDALYKPFQMQVDIILKAHHYTNKNWQTREFVGDDHSEKAWRKRLHFPFEFLLR
jgi:enterochelin esterase-like enzyme